MFSQNVTSQHNFFPVSHDFSPFHLKQLTTSVDIAELLAPQPLRLGTLLHGIRVT